MAMLSGMAGLPASGAGVAAQQIGESADIGPLLGGVDGALGRDDPLGGEHGTSQLAELAADSDSANGSLKSPRWLSRAWLAQRPSASRTVTRAGRNTGALALISGSSAMCTRWRRAAMTGSARAVSSSSANPAPPRTAIVAAACGSEYFEAK